MRALPFLASLAASALLAACVACASRFPRRGADLTSTLETLLAPPADTQPRVEIRRLRVFDAGAEPWRAVPAGDLAPGAFQPEAHGDYAVVADVRCSWRAGQEVHTGATVNWYYFVDGDLHAFEHADFEQHCRRLPRIRGVAPGSDLRETMPALLER